MGRPDAKPHRAAQRSGVQSYSSLAIGLLLTSGLVGCGGGERERLAAAFGGSIPTCASFAFQEDAQAAYERGLSYLDGDADGVACQGRPRRGSSTTAPGTGAPVTSPASASPVATVLASDGRTYVVRQAGQEMTVRWEAAGGTDASGEEAASLQQLDPTTAEVSGTDLRLRFALAAQGTLVGWTQRAGAAPSATGFGIAGSSATKLSEVSGSYRALGQRCAPDGRSCAPLAATLRVEAGGLLTLCPGAELADTCANRERRTLSTSPMGAGVWRIGSAGENLIVHRSTGGIALTFATASGVVSLHGHRDTFTSTTASLPASISFDAAGERSSAAPPFAASPFTGDLPLQGFFSNAAGDIVLVSTAGQLVAWLAGGGLRHHASP